MVVYNNFMLFVSLMIFIISQIATTGNDYWLSYWTTLEDVRRIQNISDVKQFANMYNNSFFGSIFTGWIRTACWALWMPYTYIRSASRALVLHCFAAFFIWKSLRTRVITFTTSCSSNCCRHAFFFHNNPSSE